MRAAAAVFAVSLAGCAALPPSEPAPARSPPAAAALPETKIDIVGALEQGGFARGRAPAGTSQLTLDSVGVPIAADGGFFIAFGRDAAAIAELAATGVYGVVRRSIAIAPRRFPEDRLPARLQAFEADPGFAARRSAELERIAAARAAVSSEDGWRGEWTLPAAGRISGVFGSQRFYGEEAQSPHSGLDIAAPAGTTVTAPAAGVVVLASPPQFSLEGNLVIIDHGMGLFTSYLHLGRVDVAPGARIDRGAIIGTIGSTGRTTGPHLHWGAMWRGIRFDPATLTAPQPPVDVDAK